MSDVARSNTPAPPSPLTPGEITAYLDYALERLKAQRDDLVAALHKTHEAYREINDDDALGVVLENMRMASSLASTAEDRRTENKKPFLEGGRAVDGWFKAWAAPLDRARQPVQAAMDAYAKRKLEKAEAEARAARRKAQAEADLAAEAASEALRRNQMAAASEALDRSAEAEAAVEMARQQEQRRPADHTRTYGSYGGVASARRTWGWEITDAAKVPRAFLMVNPDAIKEAARARDASGKPTAVIPGVTWVSTTKMGVR